MMTKIYFVWRFRPYLRARWNRAQLVSEFLALIIFWNAYNNGSFYTDVIGSDIYYLFLMIFGLGYILLVGWSEYKEYRQQVKNPLLATSHDEFYNIGHRKSQQKLRRTKQSLKVSPAPAPPTGMPYAPLIPSSSNLSRVSASENSELQSPSKTLSVNSVNGDQLGNRGFSFVPHGNASSSSTTSSSSTSGIVRLDALSPPARFFHIPNSPSTGNLVVSTPPSKHSSELESEKAFEYKQHRHRGGSESMGTTPLHLSSLPSPSQEPALPNFVTSSRQLEGSSPEDMEKTGEFTFIHIAPHAENYS
jgi:hypothetical protein